MQVFARFVRGETAVGIFKRFLKDTLVSGCATLCVSLALSSITKTVVPSAAPRPEAARAVEVEQVHPRESVQPAVLVPADQTRALTSVAVGTQASDIVSRTVPSEATPPKDRSRRAAAPQPALQIVQSARVEPARVIRAVEVQPLAAPSVSAPLDIGVVSQDPPEEKPRLLGRLGGVRTAISLLRQSGEAVTSTATEVKDWVWGATGGALATVLK